ncbi:tetratricopeptide repeat protein [Desulfobulbus sp. F4]|nr:tetratricopeptide repeat protein [Desulfobulbus sp. F3]MCW5200217.1 tetratricopeptide repeat protein [Desulfobulbus sp. F4]
MRSLIQRSHRLHLFLLFSLCILLYGNILRNGWHLDDSGNILYNTPLHLTNLLPKALLQTFYAHPETTGKWYRPVANFTFAINWFFGEDNPVGYHIVDILIHFLTGVMLYFSSLLLLNTPALKIQINSEEQNTATALLAAALWLCAPIHTSAVTYIVQRMAQLAALLSISAIFFYFCIRLTDSRRKQFIFSVCFFCSVLLALGSKENAVLLFPSLLLIEGIFFLQFQKLLSVVKKRQTIFLPLLLVAAIGLAIISWNVIEAQSHNYGHRNFTLSERLLTEPRILLFYLSQIFYPTASRLSIAHDITVSTSLFFPGYTLPAATCCFGFIGFALLQIHKRPLFSFAITYYFLNHLIESTALPLELIFEHRNLLPSLFLFLPISAVAVDTINSKKKAASIVIATTCTVFLFQSSLATIKRNRAWQNAGTLNEDAVSKAPHDARAKLNLAGWYIEQKRYKEAIVLCEQAERLAGREASVNTTVPIALNLKGAIAYEQNRPKEAVEYFQRAYSLRKDYTAVAEKLIATLVELKRYDEALVIIAERYQKKADPSLLLLKASILLRQKKTAESLAAYHQARPFYPDLPLITAGQAKALIMMGYHDRATQLLDWAIQQNEPVARLLQIENLLLVDAKQRAMLLLNQLIQTVPLNKLLEDLDASQKDAFQIPVEKKLLRQAVLDLSISVLVRQRTTFYE